MQTALSLYNKYNVIPLSHKYADSQLGHSDLGLGSLYDYSASWIKFSLLSRSIISLANSLTTLAKKQFAEVKSAEQKFNTALHLAEKRYSEIYEKCYENKGKYAVFFKEVKTICTAFDIAVYLYDESVRCDVQNENKTYIIEYSDEEHCLTVTNVSDESFQMKECKLGFIQNTINSFGK